MRQSIQNKQELMALAEELTGLLQQIKSIPGISTQPIQQWDASCINLLNLLSSEKLRIAVVGPIKSGKSTFLNAFLKDDYLNRGAGVVTSIVTRIQRGRDIRASLQFKSWQEVNDELNEAVELLLPEMITEEQSAYDIRNPQTRHQLQDALQSMKADRIINESGHDPNSVLLSCFLKGYNHIDSIFNGNDNLKVFDQNGFKEHRRYVGNDSYAVYLKNVLLEIDSPQLDGDIELADCQGSDSPNPLHLAKIQDHLQLVHLTLYIVSSRIGLRSADIRFLSMLKKMGIIDNVVFVVNCDISEHENIDDLRRIVQKVKEELLFFHPNPEVYSFSALYTLFAGLDSNLADKDRLRLEQWQQQKELVELSNAELARFQQAFEHRLSRQRTALLLKNPTERYRSILSGISDWIHINLELVSRDEKGVQDLTAAINQQVEQIKQIQSMVQATVDGAVNRIKGQLNRDVQHFFDPVSGKEFQHLIEFIRRYQIDVDKYAGHLEKSGFLKTLYAAYQDFKRAVEAATAERMNPEILRFVGDSEKKIQQAFAGIADSYNAIVDNAVAKNQNDLKQLGVASTSFQSGRHFQMADFEAIKQTAGLNPPAMVTFTKYSAKIKTEALLNLGMSNLFRTFKKLLRQEVTPQQSNSIKALQKGIKRMREHAEKSVVAQSKNFQENLKFHYLFRLADTAARQLSDALTDRFRGYTIGLSDIREQVDHHQIDKQKAHELLDTVSRTITPLDQRLSGLKQQIDSEIG